MFSAAPPAAGGAVAGLKENVKVAIGVPFSSGKLLCPPQQEECVAFVLKAKKGGKVLVLS